MIEYRAVWRRMPTQELRGDTSILGLHEQLSRSSSCCCPALNGRCLVKSREEQTGEKDRCCFSACMI